MKKKISLFSAIILILTTAFSTFVLTFLFTGYSYTQKFSDPLYETLRELDKKFKDNYVGELDRDEITDSIISAYIKATGDKYAYYMTAEEYKKSFDELNGRGYGIGVRVTYEEDNDYLEVYMVFPGSPAEEAGIRVGDKIYKVGDKTLAETSYNDFVASIGGDLNTFADISLYRGEESIDISVKRGQYNVISVTSRLYTGESEKKIGVVKIFEFNLSTVDQFKTAVNGLIANDADAIVFDLRDNLGGELSSIVGILDFLLPAGPILRIADGSGEFIKTYNSDDSSIDVPMVVLTNSYTASASELFTSALKDYEKAISVGTTTYGKGTVGRFFRLSDGSAVMISIQRYHPPFSDNFEGVGIEPDIYVEIPDDVNLYRISDEDDLQLHSAVEHLNK